MTEYEKYFCLDDISPSGLSWKVNKGRAKAGSPAITAIGDGYYRGRLNQKTVYAHRIIFALHNGYEPNVIDHMDGNGLNNSIANLRDGTHAQNRQNVVAKGYYYHKKDGVFMAFIGIDGKSHYLGSFSCESEARKAYVEAKRENHEFFNEERAC